MNFRRIGSQLRQVSFYIPFTLYFVVFAIASLLAWQWLHINPLQADTAFGNIYSLLLRVAFWFGVIMLGFALLTVLVSLAFLLFHKRKGGIIFKINAAISDNELDEKQTVQLFIAPVLKPFFGFIKLRIQYDAHQFSNKFSLLETSRRKFFSNEIQGTYHWHLPQIKEYKIEKALLYIEDFFQFFSIAIDLEAKSNFFTQPTTKSIKDVTVWPRKTEEELTRIEEMRKVEGEFLSYKNFENNDDVRRIVWKIYAKNKELVVRIPEVMDPYASHVYMYSSFYTRFQTEGISIAEVPFLNYYKIMAWTVYQNLVKKGFDVRYITDQDSTYTNIANEQQKVKLQVSTSRWHQDKELKSFVRTQDASIVLISSFTQPEEVQQLVDQHGKDITFILIKLTESLKRQHMLDWVQWLFVQNDKNDMDAFKRSWALHPLRHKVLENEQRLGEILKQYQEQVVLD